jgi:excisionase family DNA binding protein
MTVWHTAASAAKYLQVSKWTITEAVKSGDLPAQAIRTGRTYRIDQDEIDKWIRTHDWEPKTA